TQIGLSSFAPVAAVDRHDVARQAIGVAPNNFRIHASTVRPRSSSNTSNCASAADLAAATSTAADGRRVSAPAVLAASTSIAAASIRLAALRTYPLMEPPLAR